MISHGGVIGTLERHLGIDAGHERPEPRRAVADHRPVREVDRRRRGLHAGRARAGDGARLRVTDDDGGDVGEAHGRFLRSRPPRAGLLAMVEEIEPGATVARVRRLKGGLEASTHRVDLVEPTGTRRAVVLRRFNSTFPWFDPSRIPTEVATLASLAPTPVVAPEVVAVDAEGRWFGMPSHRRDVPAGRARAVLALGRVVRAVGGGHGRGARGGAGRRRRAVADGVAAGRAAGVVAGRSGARAGVGGDPGERRRPGGVGRRRPRAPRPASGQHALVAGAGQRDRGLADGGARLPGVRPRLPPARRVDRVGAGGGRRRRRRSAAIGIGADHPAWDLVVGLRALPSPDLWVSSYQELGIPITVEDGRARGAAWLERAMSQLR